MFEIKENLWFPMEICILFRDNENTITYHVDILFLFEVSLSRNNFQHLDVTLFY